MKRILSDEQVRDLRERAARGETDLSLALTFAITDYAVCAIRTGTRRPEAGGPITVRKRPTSKLLRERIKRGLERGETYVQIAEREKCSTATVGRVAHPVIGYRRFEGLERQVAELRADFDRLREENAALRAVVESVS